MTCKHIQEWILTDYIDGFLSPKDKAMVDGHVASCAECRSVLDRVTRLVETPLKQSPKMQANDFLLHQIKHRIAQQEQRAPKAVSLWSRLEAWAMMYKPALITSCVFVILTAVLLGGYQVHLRMLHQNMSTPSMMLIISENDQNEADGLISNIERYFL